MTVKAFKRWLCGRPKQEATMPLKELPVSKEVRSASHALNNATTILQGAVLSLRKEADALSQLAHDMHEGDKE